MVFVAKEMKRRGMNLPLLIGGATTSRQHTAVKIAPEYESPVLHVTDASRVVGVVSALLDSERRQKLDLENRASQERLRGIFKSGGGKPLLAFSEAQTLKAPIVWQAADLCTPPFIGRRVLEDVSLETLRPYIDWTYFFSAWELRGKYPNILHHEQFGEAARELFKNGNLLLDRIVRDRLIEAKGVYGFWPAQAEGEDLVLFADEARTREATRFHMLRQQRQVQPGAPCLSLTDYVAPPQTQLRDYVGAFAVTAGIGADRLARDFEQDLDDYNAIMVKALADRLAEAFAEYLHERVRRECGYEAEVLDNERLIAEEYRGIRPAFGYPACPDHTEKRALFDLLQAGDCGLSLTESFAMSPAASVSGIYLAHPEARYFNLGLVGKDQVTEYAERKRMPVSEMERWLAPNLGYEP
jgi:5-methyltetrahydrofolate--homocysteine methyltransferase